MKKSILYLITQSEFGGAQRYCFDLANGLKDEFDVFIAAGGKGELAQKCEQSGIKYFEIPNLKREISPINDILATWQIIKLSTQIKPDVVHLNSSKISILGSIAAFFLQLSNQLSVVYTVHGWVFNEPLPFWKKLFYKYAETFTSYLKNRIICVSQFDYETALENKIAPEKLSTIYNGIKPIDFYSRKEARKKLGLLDDDFIIGSIGNFYKTKGYEYLFEATKRLSEIKHNFLIAIIGEGEERKNLQKIIKKYKLENNVILLGAVEEAAKYLPAFDIYVCSSVKEGLSYTLIEAMNAGLPIVATDAGGNKELIINGKTGLIAKTADAEDLAEKIQTIVENQSLKSNLSLSAKETAEKEFTLDKMIKDTRKTYKTVGI